MLKRRHVHGTTYVDERTMLLEGDGASGTLDSYYYLLQELYTVTGLVKKNGTLTEAYVYDTYGKVTLWGYRNFDFDRDGDVEKAENTYLVGLVNANQPTSDPMADGDMDGDVDHTDASMVVVTSAGTPPITLLTSGVGNQYYFTGAKLTLYEDYTLGGVSPNLQVQFNRARHYDPNTGRWLQRDPLGLQGNRARISWARRGGPQFNGILRELSFDPTALYGYVDSNPTRYRDPSGLLGIDCRYCGPDVTTFLASLVNHAIVWRQRQGSIIRPGSSAFLNRHAYNWMRMWGGSFDWTNGQGYRTRSCPMTQKCQNTYWLCGECVHDHWIGNFMYGFMGRLLGIWDTDANAMGNIVQLAHDGAWDPPWDTAGYDIGRRTASFLRPGTTFSLCGLLRRDAALWESANTPRVITGGIVKYPIPHALKSDYKDCKKCPESLPNAMLRVPGGGFGANDFPDVGDDPYATP